MKNNVNYLNHDVITRNNCVQQTNLTTVQRINDCSTYDIKHKHIYLHR